VTVALYQNLRAWNYGPAGWDVRNNFVVNYLWNLPKGSSLWSNFLTRALLDNWQISGIASYVSGVRVELSSRRTIMRISQAVVMGHGLSYRAIQCRGRPIPSIDGLTPLWLALRSQESLRPADTRQAIQATLRR
jgi:hypothetical protein